MVSISGNVGDELLGGEGEEAGEGKRGGGGRKSGESEVVLSYGIWNLAAQSIPLRLYGRVGRTNKKLRRAYDRSVVVHFGEKVAKGDVLASGNAGFGGGFDQRVFGLRGGINDDVQISVKWLVDRVVGLGGGVEGRGILRRKVKVRHGGDINRSATV